MLNWNKARRVPGTYGGTCMAEEDAKSWRAERKVSKYFKNLGGEEIWIKNSPPGGSNILIKVRKHEVELSTNGSIILSDEFMYQLASAINEAQRTKFLENGDRVVIMDTIDELLKDTNFYS